MIGIVIIVLAWVYMPWPAALLVTLIIMTIE